MVATSKPAPAGLGGALVRGGMWSGAGRVVATLSAFLGQIALARLIAPEALGAYFVAASIVHLGATVGILGLDQTAVRLVATASTEGRSGGVGVLVGRILLLALGGAAIAGTCFYLSGGFLLDRVFATPGLSISVVAIVVWICATVFQRTISEIFRGLRDIRLATLFALARNGGLLHGLLFLAGIGVLALTGSTDLPAVVRLAAMVVVSLAVFGAVTLLRVLRARGVESETMATDPRPEGLRHKQILLQALPLMLAALMISARASGDVLVLGALSSTSEVALYGIAARIVGLVITPLMIVNAVLAPWAAEHHAEDNTPLLESTVRLAATVAALPTFLIIAGLALFGGWLLEFGFGPFYREAYAVLMLLAVGHLGNALAGPGAVVLMMTGRQNQVLVATALSAAIVLGLGGALAGTWGARGVAAATACGLWVQNLLMVTWVRRSVGISILPMVSLEKIRRAREVLRGA